LQAIWLLCTGAREAAFRNIKTIAECVADELINAAKVRGFLSAYMMMMMMMMTVVQIISHIIALVTAAVAGHPCGHRLCVCVCEIKLQCSGQ